MAGWSKPSTHALKVNCRGVFSKSKMRSSVGCVMKNNKGEWMKGAAGMIGMIVPVGAEIWSIFYGLKLSWEKGDVKHVVIECECEDPVPDFWLLDLVLLIKNLEREAWESCVIQHVPGEANAATIVLAESHLDDDGGIIELTSAPACLDSVLAADRA